MLYPFSYIIFGVHVHKLPLKIENRAVLIIACALTSMILLLVGPSKIFGFPDRVWIMVLG